MIDPLGEYLRDWYLASQSKQPPVWFGSYSGLCPNLRRWCLVVLNDPEPYRILLTAMRDLFEIDGLDRSWPFNDEELGIEYYHESDMRANPHRMAFVKRHMLPLENSP